MITLFTKIINREIPAHFVYEDDICVVILDKFPAVPDQSLVIPKQAIDYAFDLDQTTYAHVLEIAHKVARASDRAFGALRTCLVIEGFEVPHAHIKLYPMTDTSRSLGHILPEGREASDESLQVIGTQLSAALKEEGL